MKNEIIKCLKCGQILISGNGYCFFGVGTSIECRKCGNKHVFGEGKPNIENKTILPINSK